MSTGPNDRGLIRYNYTIDTVSNELQLMFNGLSIKRPMGITFPMDPVNKFQFSLFGFTENSLEPTIRIFSIHWESSLTNLIIDTSESDSKFLFVVSCKQTNKKPLKSIQ